jgi:excisionase family DNA binding protein
MVVERPGRKRGVRPWDRGKYTRSTNQIVPMLAVREVARLLNMHTNSVRRWSDRGIIMAYRINHRGDRRFRQDDIARFVDELLAHRGNEKLVSMDWR